MSVCRTPRGPREQKSCTKKHFRGDLLTCALHKALDSQENDSEGNRHRLKYSAGLRSWEAVPRESWYCRSAACLAGEGQGPWGSESHFNTFGFCCVCVKGTFREVYPGGRLSRVQFTFWNEWRRFPLVCCTVWQQDKCPFPSPWPSPASTLSAHQISKSPFSPARLMSHTCAPRKDEFRIFCATMRLGPEPEARQAKTHVLQTWHRV